MTKDEIFDAVQEIFRDIFDDEDLVITRKMTAEDIEDWDSLEQINLLTAIGKRFDLKFKLDDVSNLSNIGDMLDLVEKMVQAS